MPPAILTFEVFVDAFVSEFTICFQVVPQFFAGCRRIEFSAAANFIHIICTLAGNSIRALQSGDGLFNLYSTNIIIGECFRCCIACMKVATA